MSGEGYDFEWAAQFDKGVVAMIEAVGNGMLIWRIDLDAERDEDGVIHGNNVSGRRTLGQVLREAVKLGIVSVTPRQAANLANLGSASHDDTAADLLSTQPSDKEEHPDRGSEAVERLRGYAKAADGAGCDGAIVVGGDLLTEAADKIEELQSELEDARDTRFEEGCDECNAREEKAEARAQSAEGRVEALEAALAPFAAEAEFLDDTMPTETESAVRPDMELTRDHIEAARAALAPQEDTSPNTGERS